MIDMAYIRELLRVTFYAFVTRPRQLLITATLSFLQSGLFFAFWCVFLSRIRNIAGWDIHDMAVFTAVNEISFCLTYILAQGVYQLARTVMTGEMDTYLVRPKHPLTQILVRSSSNYGPGGLAFGLFLLSWYGGLSIDQFALALVASMVLAVLLVALVILFDSLIFFLRSDAAGESLFGMMNTLGVSPSTPSTAQ